MSMKTHGDWRSYDPIAKLYSRFAEPSYFAAPARDLVAMLDPPSGSRVLDVGAGTGATAVATSSRVGREGFVVAADLSLGMLLECRKRLGRGSAVVMRLPALACRARSFDAVIASFVLTHITDCETALDAITSVLRRGGRLGVSAWAGGASATPPGHLFQQIIESYIDSEVLEEAVRATLPWEDRFSNRNELERVLQEAGLSDIRSAEKTYEIRMTTGDYLESRLLALSSRVLASTISRESWESFQSEAARALDDSFGSRVAFAIRANLATGSI